MSNSALWRATAGDGKESLSERIEFNEGAVPDKTGAIVETAIEMEVGFSDNPKASGALNELQDTGLARIPITVTGRIKAPASSDIPGIFKRWLIEDKTNTAFPKGRFGLRLNDFPAFNLTPDGAKGYMLIKIEFSREAEYEGRLIFIATLRFNGDVGSTPYDWSS